MRVLIVKLTSMGDLIHAFPALTDAAIRCPEIEFDWVVDQDFAEIPLWHPNVRRVIRIACRRFRRQPLVVWKNSLLSKFYRELNTDDYDVVIDLQGNLKSALISLLRKGSVHGFDKGYCREKPAHCAYEYKYQVGLNQHSIERLRDLMAKAIGYNRPSTPANYGVDLKQCTLPILNFELPNHYLLFVHNASWVTKLWPSSLWQDLVERAVVHGYSVLLPSGNDEEHRRSKHIAKVSGRAYALPILSLNNVVALTKNAQGAVCSDTGLAHIAAICNIHTVTIYGATDTLLIGTYGKNQRQIVSDLSCSPCNKRLCSLGNYNDSQSKCMEEIDARFVWDILESCLYAQ